ncbi:MAG: DUF58 domain-containing protein [Oscillospiraceae bacterium]|nr:DUF58 domain-containing protein [Oscillospiraceae bacterium]
MLLFVGMYAGQAFVYSRYGLRSVTYSCRFSCDEVTEGDRLELIEEIENSGFLPLPYLRSEYAVSRWLDLADMHSTVTGRTRFVSSLFYLRGRSRITRRWKVQALQRGEYALPHVLLVSSDLLGTARSARPADPSDGILTVLPRPASGVTLPQTIRSTSFGEHPVRRGLITDPAMAYERRPYTGREPMHRIDWKTTARTGTLTVRREEPVQERRLCVCFTAQQGEYGLQRVSEEVSEHTIRVLAAVFEALTAAGEPFSVESNCLVHGERFRSPEGASPGRYHYLLQALAALDIVPPLTLREAVSVPPGARVLIVTPYISEDIRRLYARHPDAQIILTFPGDTGDLAVVPAYPTEEVNDETA